MIKDKDRPRQLTASERLIALINLGGGHGSDFFRSMQRNGGDKKVSKIINTILNNYGDNEVINKKEAEK